MAHLKKFGFSLLALSLLMASKGYSQEMSEEVNEPPVAAEQKIEYNNDRLSRYDDDALDEDEEEEIVQVKKKHKKKATRNESWYFQMGLGYVPYLDYGPVVNGAVNLLKAIPTVTHAPLGFDLGVYFPVARSTALGGALSVVVDLYSDTSGSLSISQGLLGLSVQHYLGQSIGDGFFLRADGGLARYGVTLSSGTTVTSASSDLGYGVSPGLGYSIPLSTETRLGFGAYYQYINVKEVGTNSGIVRVHLMF